MPITPKLDATLRIDGILRLEQQRDEGAAHEEHAVEIDRANGVPFLGREIGDAAPEIVAGIVDDGLDRAARLGPARKLRNPILIRHVGGKNLARPALGADETLCLLELRRGAPDGSDGRAQFAQHLGASLSDAATGPRHHDDFTREFERFEHGGHSIVPLNGVP